ncbi:MAG: hypothetical protein DMF06_08675 [Verrucomicrobia bacterium]|nr:MAG: hypothetical protein DMF06_08675 [Verrucomicrobiota bacterium]
MNEFLTAFAKAAQLRPDEADKQWADFSRALPDSERERIENGGYKSGTEMGLDFLALYPVEERGNQVESMNGL